MEPLGSLGLVVGATIGETGHDRIVRGAGDDTIDGGSGDDALQ